MRRALLSSLLLCLLLTGCAAKVHPVIQFALDTPFSASGYVPVPGDSLREPLKALEARLAELQVTVAEMPPEEHQDGQGNWGSAIPAERMIWMPPMLSVNTRFEVLAHEAAHIYQPTNATHRLGAELFAELVAWEVARYYGHDMTESSGRYLAGYKESLVYAIPYKTDIEYVFRILVGKGSVWD